MEELQGTPPMGDFSKSGGVWPSQATVSDLREAAVLWPRDDAGAPSLMTVSKASAPMRFDPYSLGNERTQDRPPTSEKSPTLLITIKYFAPGGGTRTVDVPWVLGLTVQKACYEAKQRNPLFRSVSVQAHARVVGSRRLRMHDVLQPGDLLRLNKPAAPYQ